MIISYLGIPGSNSYAAAKQYFGENEELTGARNFKEIFQLVQDKKCDLGIIPVENSLAGSIIDNYDLLFRYDLSVMGEYNLKFENHLLGVSVEGIDIETRLKIIKKVFSHPQPIAQCSRFLQEHTWIEAVAYSDTAAAAKFVAEQKDPTLAAIGNEEAAKLYSLDVIERQIADDNESNFTRFFVIGTDPKTIEESDKCSVIFTLPHVPGSLVKILEVFASANLSLTKIESRPIHGKPFEYIFYVDLKWDKNVESSTVKQAMEEAKKRTETLKILGFYKAGV